MNLDRFQPPTALEELYRCESCGERIESASTVFLDDVPYHITCFPEPSFDDDEEPEPKDEHRHLSTWIGYCTVCSIILIAALFVRSDSQQTKGILITALMGLAAIWFIWRVIRR